MPQVQRSIPYTFDAYSGGVIKDPGRGKLPDFSPESGSPTRLHQIGDGQVLFDSIDVIPHFYLIYFIPPFLPLFNYANPNSLFNII